MQYDFQPPGAIHFGWGRRTEVGLLAGQLGRRAFFVSGGKSLSVSGFLDQILASLADARVDVVQVAQIRHEPEVADVDAAADVIRQHGVRADDLVLAIGGGAALDLGKALAAMATNPQITTVQDVLEGVGKGLTLEKTPLPLLAMPTTAGTGSEATRNAVISSYDPPFKKSLRDRGMMPRIALVDPELTVSVPRQVTAATGLDAITQLIESYISARAQPLPQAFALQGLEGVVPALKVACDDGSARPARERLAQAALLSGMALANSGLGLAHGFAAAFGVHARVPHGLACAVMLPVAMRVNAKVRESELARIGCLLSGRQWSSPPVAVAAGIDVIEELLTDLSIPRRLSELGIRSEQHPDIARSARGNSMSGNPRELSDEELLEILDTVQ